MEETGTMMGSTRKLLNPRANEFRPRNRMTISYHYPSSGFQVIPFYQQPVNPPLPTYFRLIRHTSPSPETMATRSLLLSSVPVEVNEDTVRRDLEVFGELRSIQMERLVEEGIVIVHFYDLRQAISALMEIQTQYLKQQSLLRYYFESWVLAVDRNSVPVPVLPPAHGLIARKAVWAQYISPASSVSGFNNQGTIVIQNLNSGVDIHGVEEIFEAFGQVKEVRETPLKRNQRFVEFFDIRDAAKASSEMDGKEIKGQFVTIEFSVGNKRITPENQNPPVWIQLFKQANSDSSSKSHKQGMMLKQARISSWMIHNRLLLKNPDSYFQITDDSNVIRDPRTTVMIKNIPYEYSQKLLLNMLDNHCVHCNEQITNGDDQHQPLSAYDFVYLPIDFNNKCNVGYGFVNMTSPQATLRLYKAFHLQQWEVFNSRKICQVTYARLQGLEALKKHFKNLRFACAADEYLPVVFSPARDGKQLTMGGHSHVDGHQSSSKKILLNCAGTRERCK